MKKILSLILMMFSFPHLSFSQDQHFVDSLKSQLKKLNASKMESGKNAPEISDTITANILNALSREYWTCTRRGKIQAKNKGEIDMYFVEHMTSVSDNFNTNKPATNQ